MNNLLVKIFRVSILSLFIISYLFSQSTKVKSVITQTETSVLINTDLNNNISITKENKVFSKTTELFMFEMFSHRNHQAELPFTQSIVSSFRDNIRFGGFWDKFTIVNLTPSLNIKPAEFISLYAFHNLSYFVPLEGIRENIKSMAMRGGVLMAVDYAEKMFSNRKNILVPLISFAAKILLVNIINRTEKDRDKENNLLHYDYQYYSVSIRF